MTITTNNFKNGMAIMHDGKMWTIVEFQHVKPGKGGAFVRSKLKEIKSGRVVDITFRAGEKIEDIRTETKRMQYLYSDGSSCHFMDNETYEQLEIPSDVVGDGAKWMKENDEIQILYANGEMIGLEPSIFVELEVTETDPGFKGNTVQGATKPATLETGAVVQVPMFIETGEILKIDTRDGRYVTRV